MRLRATFNQDMGLRAKFNIVMLVAFVVGLVLASIFSNNLLQTGAREAVLQEAAIMMGQATAISQYTDKEVEPLLADQLKLRFLPQTIPFWAAQTNFRSLQQQFPDYSFRELAINPTNPSDRPTDWQADIIDLFRRQPKLTELVSQRDTPAGPVLSYSRPISVPDQSCLECHSSPAAAPPSMIDLYGSNNGFGWNVGETVGAQIVSVPLRVSLERSHGAFIALMGGLTVVFLIMLALLNILLHYFIILPLRRISAAASEVSLGKMDAPELVLGGRDEIASLADSFNRMRRSLTNAMKLLEQ
jgi:HAMP domain-containing protein